MQLLRASLALSLVLAGCAWGDPCVCRKDFDPVCGSDEVTYSNACMLRCARDTGLSTKGHELAVTHTGPCDAVRAVRFSTSGCVCTKVFLPVCGTDGKTYSNACDLNCAKKRGVSSKGADLAIAHNGACSGVLSSENEPAPPPRSSICPSIFDPVCGSDGKTYSSPCMLHGARDQGLSAKGHDLAVAHTGPCEEVRAMLSTSGCFCTKVFLPVCGTDGKTYSNACDLNCAKKRGVSSKGADLAVAHTGACSEALVAEPRRTRIPLPCICTRIYHPVCGTDGLTYANDCNLNCARSTGVSSKGHDLAVAHAGPCDVNLVADDSESATVPCPCPRVLLPVCGTDGNTYDNTCLLKCASKVKGGEIRVVHEGEC